MTPKEMRKRAAEIARNNLNWKTAEEIAAIPIPPTPPDPSASDRIGTHAPGCCAVCGTVFGEDARVAAERERAVARTGVMKTYDEFKAEHGMPPSLTTLVAENADLLGCLKLAEDTLESYARIGAQDSYRARSALAAIRKIMGGTE